MIIAMTTVTAATGIMIMLPIILPIVNKWSSKLYRKLLVLPDVGEAVFVATGVNKVVCGVELPVDQTIGKLVVAKVGLGPAPVNVTGTFEVVPALIDVVDTVEEDSVPVDVTGTVEVDPVLVDVTGTVEVVLAPIDVTSRV